jgi:hypothetical protein
LQKVAIRGPREMYGRGQCADQTYGVLIEFSPI